MSMNVQRRSRVSWWLLPLALLATLALWRAASAPGRSPAVPAGMTLRAQVPGLGDVRYIVGHEPDMQRLRDEVTATWARQRQALAPADQAPGTLPPAALLALSGGGDGGAFGAGLLTGWTASDPNRIGQNPAGGLNIFADNGAVPNGTRVAFIQSNGSTSTL